jgi:hypothetical protein
VLKIPVGSLLKKKGGRRERREREKRCEGCHATTTPHQAAPFSLLLCL